MNIPYQPINCHFYDELELLAIRRRSCEIIYLNEAREEIKRTDVIIDFKIKNQVEFMILKSGTAIRLDWLIRVDGKVLKGFC